MNISNPTISTSEKGAYSISNNDPKPLNIENAVTFLAEKANSRSADRAKDLITAQIKPDSMFMAGIGIQSLGYTFLLLQMYSELEVELMKNSTEQAALTSEMYKNMSQLEMKMAEDIKASGFAKGLSQIAGAFANLGAAAYTMKQKKDITKKYKEDQKEAVITGTPTEGERARVRGNLQETAPQSSPPQDERARVDGEINAPQQEKGPTKKEREDKYHKDMEAAGSLATLLGRSLDQALQGTGAIIAAGYDADRQVQEGLKHLVQMIMGNADTQKSRLQQQYEEAAKKMEDAIQAYNAAMNASH